MFKCTSKMGENKESQKHLLLRWITERHKKTQIKNANVTAGCVIKNQDSACKVQLCNTSRILEKKNYSHLLYSAESEHLNLLHYFSFPLTKLTQKTPQRTTTYSTWVVSVTFLSLHCSSCSTEKHFDIFRWHGSLFLLNKMPRQWKEPLTWYVCGTCW